MFLNKKFSIGLIRWITTICILFFFLNEIKAQQVIEGIYYYTGLPVQVTVKNGMIESITVLDKPVSKNSVYIAPDFFDNQVNGFAGVSFALGDSNLAPEGIEKATRELWKKGVTTYLPTLTTNSIEVLTRSFELLYKAVDDVHLRGSIPGFHLEGHTSIRKTDSEGRVPNNLQNCPTGTNFMKLHEASGKNILQVTLAPEMDGALDFISKCSQNGITVALGLHNADMKTITAAIDRGAKIATHLGNGAANMINRHRNPF